MLKKLLFITLLMMLTSAHARPGFLDGLGLGLGDSDAPPLVEEAFQINSELSASDQILVSWTVLEGNYLYKDKIRFEVLDNNDISISNYVLPEGENKMDETFGLTEVYHHDISTTLTLDRPPTSQSFTLKAHYQGCSETFGICYPPTETALQISLPAMPLKSIEVESNTTNAPIPPLSEQDRIAQKLANDNLIQIIIGFLGLGLLLAFTPCVFPMIPILSSIIVGEGEYITTRRAFLLSLIYVLSMSVTYTSAGILTGLLGENLQAMFQNPWIIYSFSALFLVLALSMFGLFELQLPHFLQHRLHQISHKQQGGHLAGVVFMGLLSGLIVGPCLAPPLAGALIFIGQSADPFLGGTALFALSMGMGIPLLIIGTSAGSLLPKAGDWMNTIKSIFGVLLIGLAIWMLERIIPGWVTLMLWGSLFVVSAIYIGALNSLNIDANGWSKLWKGLGLVLMIYGSILIIGGASGGQSPWQPLKAFASSTQNEPHNESLAFIKINNLDELNTRLNQSNGAVMLDFYADWCTDCKIMEKTTFSDPDVIKALSTYDLLQLDMTDNTEDHQALLKKLRVFGPPTILFFNPNDQELKGYRLVGHVDAQQLLNHIAILPKI